MPTFFVTPTAIDELMDWLDEADNEGSHYPGLSYEQGVRDTLDWLAGHGSRPDKDE